MTAGTWKGRALKTPDSHLTRPTQARLRQALFNSIQFEVQGAKILDLFSGAGTLGFEALSRGAGEVVFVESALPALKCLERNIEEFEVQELTQVLKATVLSVRDYLYSVGPFDIILADPPYQGGFEMKLLEDFNWDKLLTPSGLFILEWGKLKSKVGVLPDSINGLTKKREKIYGDSVLTHYRRAEENREEEGVIV